MINMLTLKELSEDYRPIHDSPNEDPADWREAEKLNFVRELKRSLSAGELKDFNGEISGHVRYGTVQEGDIQPLSFFRENRRRLELEYVFNDHWLNVIRLNYAQCGKIYA